jgi:hypothetical protein
MKVRLKSRFYLKMALYLLGAAFFSLVFSFLAAPILRVLKQQVSPYFYWFFSFLWCLLLFSPATLMLGLLLLKIWLVVGVYGELEFKAYLRPYLNIIVSTTIATLLILVIGGALSQRINLPIEDQLNLIFAPLLKSSVNSWLSLKVTDLIPSIVFFLNLSNLIFAVALDRRMAEFMKMPLSLPVLHPRLLDFKSPDFIIWPFLLSVFLAFYRGTPSNLIAPTLNLAIMLASIFFFQGLAVVENILYTIRAGLLIRILVYVLLAGQMFILLLGIGLIDYWVDIRSHFSKWFKK